MTKDTGQSDGLFAANDNYLPKTRSEAISLGLKYYRTGKPCKRGHVTTRNVDHRACRECAREKELLASRKKRSDPEYRAKERKRNAAYAARKRAEDPEWVKQKNASNRAVMQRRRDNDPEYVERTNALRRWLNENDEQYRERQRKYLKQWTSENKDKIRVYFGNRRARERGAEGSYTHEDISRINTSQDFKCTYCCAPTNEDYHVDHIVPLSRGGSNWPSNLQMLCPTCNMRKNAKDHFEFLAMLAANDNFKLSLVETS